MGYLGVAKESRRETGRRELSEVGNNA
jgi:hypothetical protein